MTGRRVAPGAVAVLALVVTLLALLAYGLSSVRPDTGVDDRLSEARAAKGPGFSLPLLQRGTPGRRLEGRLRATTADGTLASDELQGTPYVLNFWASWCPPCRTETPELERTWRAARRRGILFLGLNMQDVRSDARDFMRELDVSYPNVRDQSDEVARRWGVAALPETFFVDARGRVVGHVIGSVSQERLRGGLEAARTGRVLGSAQGGPRRSTR